MKMVCDFIKSGMGQLALANLVITSVAYTFMFQYILWSVFGQDVPWHIDVVAGVLLGEYKLPALFAVCLVLRHCDYSVPLFKSVKAALGY